MPAAPPLLKLWKRGLKPATTFELLDERQQLLNLRLLLFHRKVRRKEKNDKNLWNTAVIVEDPCDIIAARLVF
jgi:hypothetical protein